jgi:hypothetical protein
MRDRHCADDADVTWRNRRCEAAFTGWMLVQSPGVFDVWWPGSSMAGRVVIVAFTTIVLGALAKALGYQADQAGQPAAVRFAAEVPAAGELITR